MTSRIALFAAASAVSLLSTHALAQAKPTNAAAKRKRSSPWNNDLLFKGKGATLWQAAQATGYRREAAE